MVRMVRIVRMVRMDMVVCMVRMDRIVILVRMIRMVRISELLGRSRWLKNFFDSDFEICIISLLVMSKY
jgi:hypothetical protein